ncbi:ABC transporter ATP-binding protein [Streptomyces asoensis]|uniref:Multidrug ABC transporter ATP-binding protein n=1 Tax=Streptomyces asoensis TaxID=249586 RepID=A0ABQ3S8Y5_9ACTN|nr:ABC transporter ATP-binding protein [Streptomyces asoensis]GGQ72323.1 multidrug ABC transporter ATP-binding protein [Streptomyces asoensis]GHI64591.1 multidrug ABC transporter ATP-binding protein [Streptomyces asoensis]
MGSGEQSGRDVLTRSVRGQARRVGLGAALGCVHQLGEAVVPVLIGVVIDQAVAGQDAGRLLLWLAVLAVVYVTLSWSFRLGARAGERGAEEAAHTLRLAIVRRVLDARGGAEDGRLPGELANVATEDAKRVGAVNMALMSGTWAVAGVTASAVALLLTSVPLGLIVLLGTPVLLWLGHLLSKPLERRSEAEQDRAAHASGVAADLVAGLRVLKGLGAQRAAVERYRGTSRLSLAATLRAARAESWQTGLVLALTGGFIALIALVGGRLALDGSLSLGQLVSAVGLALFLLGPLETFAWVNAELAQGRASAARIAQVLAAEPAVVGGDDPVPQPVRGALRLRGVRLGDGTDGIDLDVAAGRLTGIAVTDPACAEALLRCLGRERDPESGTVELDGVPLNRFDPAQLRAAVLVAAHDAVLFDGSLADNVTPRAEPEDDGTPDGSAAEPSAGDGTGDADADVLTERAMCAAHADEVARSLPHGTATGVGEGGRSLSGGQRQRVLLARALRAGPPVLVVHDPTTAVDALTEARIAEGLREIRRGRTTLVVTNSPALLAVADRVVLLDGGRVGAEGTHAELVRADATYRTAVLA